MTRRYTVCASGTRQISVEASSRKEAVLLSLEALACECCEGVPETVRVWGLSRKTNLMTCKVYTASKSGKVKRILYFARFLR